MSSEKKKLDPRALLDQAVNRLRVVRRYSLVIFLLFIAGLYGFVLLRISALVNTQPTTDAVSSQVQAAQIPHIDQTVVNQLQSLQDNSVSVKTLFNQERSNPFQ